MSNVITQYEYYYEDERVIGGGPIDSKTNFDEYEYNGQKYYLTEVEFNQRDMPYSENVVTYRFKLKRPYREEYDPFAKTNVYEPKIKDAQLNFTIKEEIGEGVVRMIFRRGDLVETNMGEFGIVMQTTDLTPPDKGSIAEVIIGDSSKNYMFNQLKHVTPLGQQYWPINFAKFLKEWKDVKKD